ncbi:MAG: RNA polymerase factor sigma-32 [Flavobacteriaceae bacterium]|jgi:RNA polymerase sigma-32 factor|nr:RNA polymerase factor sigma-32 [Pelagibacteraceae bacterium]MBT5857692.1 RNA polymerase factor sigma-32 [Flavobacteriaceae bacterium]
MTSKNLFSNNLVDFSKKSKILEKKEEFFHIEEWRIKRNSKSLKIILNAYLRLAVSYARKYSSYGLPLDDLIHEGVLGIMHALEKFDVSKDFRLSTYASWWIRASIQDYILKNWSVVKTGSTASQKALFFNLRKIKKQISDVSSNYMGQKEIDKVSDMLNVKKLEVQNMESRLSGGDVFLNQKIDNDSENDLMSLLQDERANPEEVLEDFSDGKLKKEFINKAISTLNEREKIIIKLRKLKEKSITLDELGNILKISKERVRQIETKALEKLKTAILDISQQNKEFFI